MLPGLKLDVVFERGNGLEADTAPDVGPDGTENIVLRFTIVVEVGPGLEELELWYDGVDADSRGTVVVALPEGLNPVDPVAKELDAPVEELRSGNGVEDDMVLPCRFEELRLPPTASADVVVVALLFEGGVAPATVVERGVVVTPGALEFVA